MRMHMGHVALRVTDPDRFAAHAEEGLGLRRTLDDAGSVFLSCNEKHHEVQLIASGTPGLDHIGLEVEDERDLDRLRDALVAAGAEIVTERPDEKGLGQAFRAGGPEGVVFELYAGMEREPLSVAHYLPPLARRFGHVTLTVEDRPEMERFLTGTLYTPDLENAIVEAFADLLHVENESTYEPIDWSYLGDEALNLWGPPPPPDWRDYGIPILLPAWA